MIPPPVPIELQGLTQVEEMLVARALPIMQSIFKLREVRKHKRPCFNFTTRCANRSISDLPIIVFSITGEDGKSRYNTIDKIYITVTVNQ